MQFGSLYDHAVRLSPRAAHIAAGLLARDPSIPAPLRRSLSMALGSATDLQEMSLSWGAGDRDARAAWQFVQACQAVCAVKPDPRAGASSSPLH
ncbi:hypothetical protein ACSFA0_25695 [Variovorax sp. LT1P1]|uniref:hypothetical protein n=1 Tax=Variovorax sp. LT1P1 TaxID=3443730 RepID=UPI003F4681CE